MVIVMVIVIVIVIAIVSLHGVPRQDAREVHVSRHDRDEFLWGFDCDFANSVYVSLNKPPVPYSNPPPK